MVIKERHLAQLAQEIQEQGIPCICGKTAVYVSGACVYTCICVCVCGVLSLYIKILKYLKTEVIGRFFYCN